MARRKPHSTFEPSAIFGLLAILALLWLTGQFLDDSPHGSGTAASLVIVAAFAAGAICPFAARRLYRAAAAAREQDGEPPHAAALPAAPSSRVPSPPPLSPAPTRLALPDLGADPVLASPRKPPEAMVDDTAGGGRLPLHTVYPGMSPSAFASFCARQLLRCGWEARIATQRPDSQADLVAEREGCRVALQCAVDAHAVGYRAVQQAAAIRADAHAAVAAVVSSNGYTAAAQHLAAANHILLLHYRDLPALDRILAHNEQSLAAEPA